MRTPVWSANYVRPPAVPAAISRSSLSPVEFMWGLHFCLCWRHAHPNPQSFWSSLRLFSLGLSPVSACSPRFSPRNSSTASFMAVPLGPRLSHAAETNVHGCVLCCSDAITCTKVIGDILSSLLSPRPTQPAPHNTRSKIHKRPGRCPSLHGGELADLFPDWFRSFSGMLTEISRTVPHTTAKSGTAQVFMG